MKPLLIAFVAAVSFFSASAFQLCRAQTVTIAAPEYAALKLFDSSPGRTITGMGASSNGDLFYLESDAAFPPALVTTLSKRIASDNYATPTPLFAFSTPAFGAFVVFHEGTVYFGESSAGTIHAIAADGSGHRLLGTVPGVYDLSFSGGDPYVSSNPETDFSKPPRNEISRFDLTTGALDSILDTGGDFSGPLEFDADGNLLYGATAVGTIRDLHSFTPSEVATAFGPGTLSLSPPSHRLIANGKNVYLAFGGGASLWKEDFNTLTLHDLVTRGSRAIATTTDTFGQLDAPAGNLLVTVTSFAAGRSAVFAVEPIPEPSIACLLLLGALPLFRTRTGARR
ncbi:MAG TPA: hypothetical protein VFV83_06420 [Chthoniobacteraceae bacterium]|nr:hypothetical protein [Chthoniobacteraceae bacterium]